MQSKYEVARLCMISIQLFEGPDIRIIDQLQLNLSVNFTNIHNKTVKIQIIANRNLSRSYFTTT